MASRFPRAIRLDDSDSRVYEVAAEPGEWAIPGAFAFADAESEGLSAKARQAFARGFLGTTSFGWTTLVEVAEISESELEALIERLAAHFVERYGAPDLERARAAARAEAEFAAGLCEHKLHTLLALERDFGDQGIVERFKAIQPPRQAQHTKIWSIVEDDEGEGS